MQRLPDGAQSVRRTRLSWRAPGLERVASPAAWLRIFNPGNAAGGGARASSRYECAIDDWQTRRLLSLIDDPNAHSSADAEREVLWVLNGHCIRRSPAFSTIDGTQMSLTASVLDEAGSLFIEASRSGPANRPRELRPCGRLELLDKECGRDHRKKSTRVSL